MRTVVLRGAAHVNNFYYTSGGLPKSGLSGLRFRALIMRTVGLWGGAHVSVMGTVVRSAHINQMLTWALIMFFA